MILPLFGTTQTTSKVQVLEAAVLVEEAALVADTARAGVVGVGRCTGSMICITVYVDLSIDVNIGI